MLPCLQHVSIIPLEGQDDKMVLKIDFKDQPLDAEHVKTFPSLLHVLSIDDAQFLNDKILMRRGPKLDLNRIALALIIGGRYELLETLLRDPLIIPHIKGGNTIRLAAERGCLTLVELLLQGPQAKPEAAQSRAIWLASANGHLEVVKVLLQDARGNPGAKNNRAIWLASANGHLEVVEVLLQDARVDPCASNNRAIRASLDNGHLEIADLLRRHIEGQL